jgi:hypothetical protein
MKTKNGVTQVKRKKRKERRKETTSKAIIIKGPHRGTAG